MANTIHKPRYLDTQSLFLHLILNPNLTLGSHGQETSENIIFLPLWNTLFANKYLHTCYHFFKRETERRLMWHKKNQFMHFQIEYETQ